MCQRALAIINQGLTCNTSESAQMDFNSLRGVCVDHRALAIINQGLTCKCKNERKWTLTV